jgi:hypothetical protein
MTHCIKAEAETSPIIKVQQWKLLKKVSHSNRMECGHDTINSEKTLLHITTQLQEDRLSQ